MTSTKSALNFIAIGLTLIAVLSLLAIPACSSGAKTSNTTSSTSSTASGVSFARDIQSIFNNNCVVCHQGAGQAGLTLEPNLSYGKLVGVPSTESASELRVKAGAPDQSYLIAKLQGTQSQAGGSGAQMPFNGTPLSSAQIGLVQQWISDGAPNN
jgi:mono/diheme cytochrome c family protein